MKLKDWTCAKCVQNVEYFGSLIYHLKKKWKLHETLFFLWLNRILCSHFSIIYFKKICILVKNRNHHYMKVYNPLLYFNHFNCPSSKIAWWQHSEHSNWNIPIFSFHLNYILILVKTKEVFILPAYSDYNCSSGCFCNRDFN